MAARRSEVESVHMDSSNEPIFLMIAMCVTVAAGLFAGFSLNLNPFVSGGVGLAAGVGSRVIVGGMRLLRDFNAMMGDIQ